MSDFTFDNVRILVRRDTAANWTSENPVLFAGELGLNTDTNGLKIGNGVDDWATLPYFAGEVGSSTPQDLTYSAITTASGTVALVSATHKSRILICNNATATTVTVEDDTTGGWTDAAELMIIQGHLTGTVTIQADGTCSINGSTSFSTTTSGQYSVIALKRIGANTWVCMVESNLLDDVTPQLGGDLDCNGHTIYFGTAENTQTPTGTLATIDLGAENHHTLNCGSATGAITLTLTVPPGPAAGTIIVVQDTTAQDITWVSSSGTVLWLGTEPTWADDDASITNNYRIVDWRWDGLRLFLYSTGSVNV